MEKLIIEKLKAGDEKAFEYIYSHYYALLCRFATHILNNPLLAEEIVNDMIFYLWEHRTDIEFTHSIRAYLMRAVRNRCLNELNSLAHREELRFSSFMLPENMEFLETIFIPDEHPLGSLLEKELEEKLTQCINELPAECRTVFKKSRFEQKSNKEIAAELNISINTVKYHIKNALSFLQQRMSNYLKLLILYFLSGI